MYVNAFLYKVILSHGCCNHSEEVLDEEICIFLGIKNNIFNFNVYKCTSIKMISKLTWTKSHKTLVI